MDFYSVMAAPRYVIEQSTLNFVPIGPNQSKPVRTRGVTVEFKPLDPASKGVPWYGKTLNTRANRVRGSFSTEDPDIINALREHDAYGKEFVAIDEDGNELLDEDYYFVELDSGEVMFTLTGKRFKSMQGAMGWKQSNEFKEVMEEARQKIRDSLQT